MTNKAVFPRQGMPLATLAPYIEMNPRPAKQRAAVPIDLSTKSQMTATQPIPPGPANMMPASVEKHLPVAAVQTALLVRDRLETPDSVIQDLAQSIQRDGLQNPIVVQDTPDGFELVEGARRLAAFRLLLQQTDDLAWAKIPAIILHSGTAIEELYHRMIAENLRGDGLSLAEMATVAMAFAADPDTPHKTIDGAIGNLFDTLTHKQRSAVSVYARVLNFIGPDLAHPNGLDLNLMMALATRIERDPGAVRAIRKALNAAEARTAADETDLLWKCVAGP